MKAFLSFAWSSLALCGCVYIPPVWEQATEKEIASIEVGVTDRATVIKYFGEPNVLESDEFIVHHGESDYGFLIIGGPYSAAFGLIGSEDSHIALEFDEDDVVKHFYVQRSDAVADYSADTVVQKCRRTLITPTNKNEFGLSVAFDTNGRYLAIGDSGNRVFLWDLTSEAAPSVLVGDKECGAFSLCWVNDIVFSPDSKKLAAASIDNGLVVWDVQTGKRLYVIDVDWSDFWGGERVTAHAFSPDGEILLIATNKRLATWNGSTGQLLKTIERLQSDISALSYSKDGEWVVTTSEDGTARLLSADDFEVIDRIERGVPLTSVALSEDGKELALGSSVHIELWELQQASKVSPLRSLTDVFVMPVTPGFYKGGSLSFSPDKQRLVGVAGSAVIWNTDSREIEEKLAPGESCCFYFPSISAALFSPSGKTIAITGNTGAYLCDQ